MMMPDQHKRIRCRHMIAGQVIIAMAMGSYARKRPTLSPEEAYQPNVVMLSMDGFRRDYAGLIKMADT